MMSRKLRPGRTSSSDLALSMPIEVPSPPLSFTTAVAASASLGRLRIGVQVGQSGQFLDGFQIRLGQQTGLAGGEHFVRVGEHRDGARVNPVGRHQLSGTLQSVATHARNRRAPAKSDPAGSNAA